MSPLPDPKLKNESWDLKTNQQGEHEFGAYPQSSWDLGKSS